MPEPRAFVEKEYEKPEDKAPQAALRVSGKWRKTFAIERRGIVLATFSSSLSVKQFFLGENGLTVKAIDESFSVDGSPYTGYRSMSAFGRPLTVAWDVDRSTTSWPSPFGNGRIVWGEFSLDWRLHETYQIVDFFGTSGTRVLSAVHPWRDKYADVLWHASFDVDEVDDQLVVIVMVGLYLSGLARTLSHVTP